MELEIVGLAITRAFRNASALEVELDDDGHIGFTLEAPYVVIHAEQIRRMRPAVDDDGCIRACFEPLYGVEIESAVVRETGEIRLEFVDGASLDCGPGEMYEPWAY